MSAAGGSFDLNPVRPPRRRHVPYKKEMAMSENQTRPGDEEKYAGSPMDSVLKRIEVLTSIGAALSTDHNIDHLLKFILHSAKELLHADGGTIYCVKGNEVVFEILTNDTLHISIGGAAEKKIDFPRIKLYDENCNPNNAMVVAYSVLHDKTINIRDAYDEQGFDFSGTKKFDQKMGYRSKSFLTVPMKNHENEIIGVLQLLNAQDKKTGEVIAFSLADQKFAESLASQAAVALTNRQLIDQLKELFHAFVKVINNAIDDKSPYTGSHCLRVPALTLMIAEAVSETSAGILKDFTMTNKDRRELELAGLLHDCGKQGDQAGDDLRQDKTCRSSFHSIKKQCKDSLARIHYCGARKAERV
jgi:hypothetical protein